MKTVVIFTVLLSFGVTAQAETPKTIKELVAEFRAMRLAYEKSVAKPVVQRCVPVRTYQPQRRWIYRYNPYNSYNFPPGSFIDSRIHGFHYHGLTRRRRL
jgi:hypothetical protein